MCCHCGCGSQHHWGHHVKGRHHGEGYERGHGRRFLTKAEKAEKLKSYAEELKNELVAVEEHIKELSG